MHATIVMDAGAEAAADAGEPLPSLEVLSARGPTEAPGMHVAALVPDALHAPEIRADKDVCLRALYAANRPVRAWLEDETKTVRGDVAPAATSGLVPPRGPACARKGEAMKLVFDSGSDPLAARAVIWMAP